MKTEGDIIKKLRSENQAQMEQHWYDLQFGWLDHPNPTEPQGIIPKDKLQKTKPMEDAIKIFKTVIVNKTRRRHQCWNCGEKKPKGSQMTNTTFSYDERLVSVYRCSECQTS